jgi:hypothetical protein
VWERTHVHRTGSLSCCNPGRIGTMVGEKEQHFDYFMECLREAATRIEPHYFQVEVAGLARPVFRERVYCYELYHQLRNVLDPRFPYKLDGEIDKRRHPRIEAELGAKKPDFVVHEPGDMGRNLVVIEVKALPVRTRALSEDLSTLEGFLKIAQYHRGVLLLYGGRGHDDLPDVVASRIKEAREQEERILPVWHRGPKEMPEDVPVVT